MKSYTDSPLGITLYSQSDYKPNSVGKYSVISSEEVKRSNGNIDNYNTFTSLFTNDSSTDPFFKFSTQTNYSSDIKTSSIIEDSQNIPAMKLKYSDFAYLKNLGVYPNNRLIIARRFDSGVNDDLRSLNATLEGRDMTPISTLISWVPDNTEFISTKFGEEWVESDATFRNILNDLGKDTLVGDNKGKNLGDFMAGAGGGVSLPGFTEGLQQEIFRSLGMSELDAANLPLGNPNLIRQSKRRKTIAKEDADSGLKCKFSVEMTVEYEQKFINGVDPTIVYYDIIANALTFGTSESKFQFRGDFVNPQFKKFLDDIGSGDPKILKAALLDFVGKVAVALRNVGNAWIDKLDKAKRTASEATKEGGLKNVTNSIESGVANFVSTIGTTIVAGLVSKYKLRILGVVNSLTGSPSAPWHVTVGNPRRPIFSSGDMLVENVEISLGKLLSFNDLPSSIKLKLTLESARNIGAQEIYKKFNCGKERSYVKFKYSFAESNVSFTSGEIQAAGEKGRIDSLQRNAVSSSNKISDVTKIGNESFPDAIKNIPGIQYQRNATQDANGEYALVAVGKTTQRIRNSDGSLSTKVVETQFYPNGRQILLDDSGKRIGSGSYKIQEDGSVLQTPDDNKFVGGSIG